MKLGLIPESALINVIFLAIIVVKKKIFSQPFKNRRSWLFFDLAYLYLHFLRFMLYAIILKLIQVDYFIISKITCLYTLFIILHHRCNSVTMFFVNSVSIFNDRNYIMWEIFCPREALNELYFFSSLQNENTIIIIILLGMWSAKSMARSRFRYYVMLILCSISDLVPSIENLFVSKPNIACL